MLILFSNLNCCKEFACIPSTWTIVLCFVSCRRHKEKKEEAAEPEIDPERDQRTVFAYQVFLFPSTSEMQ